MTTVEGVAVFLARAVGKRMQNNSILRSIGRQRNRESLGEFGLVDLLTKILVVVEVGVTAIPMDSGKEGEHLLVTTHLR